MAKKERKSVLLRLDPEVHEALSRWAGDELRSTNAQIEYLLRAALARARRLPRGVRADADALPRRGRPPKDAPDPPRTDTPRSDAAEPRSDDTEETP